MLRFLLLSINEVANEPGPQESCLLFWPGDNRTFAKFFIEIYKNTFTKKIIAWKLPLHLRGIVNPVNFEANCEISSEHCLICCVSEAKWNKKEIEEPSLEYTVSQITEANLALIHSTCRQSKDDGWYKMGGSGKGRSVEMLDTAISLPNTFVWRLQFEFLTKSIDRERFVSFQSSQTDHLRCFFFFSSPSRCGLLSSRMKLQWAL